MNKLRPLSSSKLRFLAGLRSGGGSKKARREANAAVIVGERSVREVIEAAGEKVEALFFLGEDHSGVELRNAVNPRRICYSVKDAASWRRLTGMKTTTNERAAVAAKVKLPDESPLDQFEQCKSILVLNGIQDPGNLGTLARCAMGFGFEGFYVIGQPACCPFNDKALNASKSAMWTFGAMRAGGGNWEEVAEISKSACTIAAASGGEKCSDILAKCSPKDRVIVALGSESSGLDPAAFDVLHNTAGICAHGVESLNVGVAGGILMHEIAQWRERAS